MQKVLNNVDGKHITNNKLSQQSDNQIAYLIDLVVCNGDNMPSNCHKPT